MNNGPGVSQKGGARAGYGMYFIRFMPGCSVYGDRGCQMKEILPISVVIPTMNRLQTLKNTLDGYCLKNYVPSQIIVVDQSDKEIADEVNILCGGGV